VPAARRSVLVAAPPDRFAAVLTDFANYPRFCPDLEEAVVLRSEAAAWDVRFVLRIIRRMEYTLRVAREGAYGLQWSLIEGVFRSNTGRWSVAPAEGGTLATWEVDLDLGMYLPGCVRNTLERQHLPAMLDAFRTRAEALA
jgi:ribosome-associated toxin RatA of RatAB toxin-antitoxin module